MKYTIGFLIGIVVSIGFVVHAADRGQNIPVRVLTIDSPGYGGLWDNTVFYKFVDPDNGNVCYATSDMRGGISCVKP
jgi:hypothetical protein